MTQSPEGESGSYGDQKGSMSEKRPVVDAQKKEDSDGLKPPVSVLDY